MYIVIRSTASQKEELLQKNFPDNVQVQWINADENFSAIHADAFFDLVFNDNAIEQNELIDDTIVFVHGVNCVCSDIDKPNYVRLNGWPGFLNRSITELACSDESIKTNAAAIFNKLGWNFFWTKDDYGLIAARIIAMIINEAYYALEENVSTKEQIDIAMKLGTNYPFGPFEWSEKIGLNNILQLLEQLQKQDERYSISSVLIKESFSL
jgi:3-hydroxybutyryl-CoA dehydrogenase